MGREDTVGVGGGDLARDQLQGWVWGWLWTGANGGHVIRPERTDGRRRNWSKEWEGAGDRDILGLGRQLRENLGFRARLGCVGDWC